MRTLFFLLILAGLVSCEPESKVSFENPQPLHKKSEQELAKRYHGEYQSLSSSSSLRISEQAVIKVLKDVSSITKAEIDSLGFQVREDQLFIPDSKQFLPIIDNKKDTFVVKMELIDTLFYLSKGDVLKYFKGNYFLNRQLSNGTWETTRLGFNANEQLEIGKINDSLEIQQISQLTPVSKIANEAGVTEMYVADPSKKELKKFIKSNGFSVEEKYIKVN